MTIADLLMIRFVLVSPIVRFSDFCLRFGLSDDSIDHEELWQPAWGVRTGELGCS